VRPCITPQGDISGKTGGSKPPPFLRLLVLPPTFDMPLFCVFVHFNENAHLCFIDISSETVDKIYLK
jgi:hypothetical protein